MTSRERLKKALDFQETDSVPFDLGATTVSGITRIAYENAMQERGIVPLFENMNELDPIQQIVQPVEQNLIRLGVDTVRVGAPRLAGPEVKLPQLQNGAYVLEDQFGCEWKYAPGSDYYYNLSSSPLLASDTIESGLKSYRFPCVDEAWDEISPLLKSQFTRKGDFGVIADRNSAGITEVAFRIRGYEKFFMDLALDPDGAMALMEQILQYKLDYWTHFEAFVEVNNVKDEIMVAVECDDLGTQDSLLCSPEMIRTMIMPMQEKLVRHIKSLFPDIRVMYHSDGAIFDLIPDFIEMGVDILNPVQFSAQGMDLKRLKSEFGKEIVFWGGGIDTQDTLPHGTPQQVADEVKRNIDILAPGGGFVFSAVHNVQADVPPENFWAMWDALKNH